MTANEIRWREIIFDTIDYAFEPIVNIHTGAAFGFEALMRNYEQVGFGSITEFFTVALEEGVLFQVDSFLRERAVQKFAQSGLSDKVKLFLNVDNRIIYQKEFQTGGLARVLQQHGLSPSSVCLEISEQHEIKPEDGPRQVLQIIRSQTYKLAIDDFGTGYSGLQMLYHAEPDFIKIDRFFISGIASDSKKRFFVANIINMAHLLGVIVIAEGVETEQEFFICRDLGCDMVQGHLVQMPTQKLDELKLKYEVISDLVQRDRRKTSNDQKIILDQIEFIPQISIETEMETVFNYFLENGNITFCPVTTADNTPLGIVFERDLKRFSYSLYGRESLKNPATTKTLKDFVKRTPITDINTKPEKMLEMMAKEDDAEGIILIDDMKYAGFLSMRSLLRVLHEKNLAAARDQNPLTKLPGNNVINSYVATALDDSESYVIVYFDLDNFKPYNDKYGFRRGDKVILLFASIMKSMFSRDDCFIGHIGGDDFFLGFKNVEFERAYHEVSQTLVNFKEDVKAYYDDQDRENGYVVSKDRDGNTKRFPLLSVSAAMLEIPNSETRVSMEEISLILAELKKYAKVSAEKIGVAAVFTRQSSDKEDKVTDLPPTDMMFEETGVAPTPPALDPNGHRANGHAALDADTQPSPTVQNTK